MSMRGMGAPPLAVLPAPGAGWAAAMLESTSTDDAWRKRFTKRVLFVFMACVVSWGELVAC